MFASITKFVHRIGNKSAYARKLPTELSIFGSYSFILKVFVKGFASRTYLIDFIRKKSGEKTETFVFNSKERDFKICPCLHQIRISINRIPSIRRYAFFLTNIK